MLAKQISDQNHKFGCKEIDSGEIPCFIERKVEIECAGRKNYCYLDGKSQSEPKNCTLIIHERKEPLC